MKNYTVIKERDRYTIGEYDEGYKAYIINDGICQYYYWGTKEAAQAAADAYNAYDGSEWLGEHGYGNDRIYLGEINDVDADMVDLYRLFGAVDDAPRRISLDNGRTYTTAAEAMPEITERGLWDVIANAMDDETREAVHNELAPCTEQEFLTRYLERATDDLIIG